MFVASIWMLVTSVKNEREAYRILKESSDYFEQSKLLDSLIELKMVGRDSRLSLSKLLQLKPKVCKYGQIAENI